MPGPTLDVCSESIQAYDGNPPPLQKWCRESKQGVVEPLLTRVRRQESVCATLPVQ